MLRDRFLDGETWILIVRLGLLVLNTLKSILLFLNAINFYLLFYISFNESLI